MESESGAHEPAVHYDIVTDAWPLLLGDDFHYGYFRAPGESLAEATRNLTELMAARAAAGAGMSVLDVGCGIGTPAIFLAEHHGCRVVGITTSAAGVIEAERRACERGLSDCLSFRLADGMKNGLPDDSFDRVWALESSHLMHRKGDLLAECARVLRPGGRLVLCDIIRRREIPMREVMRRARMFRELDRAFGRARMEPLSTYRSLAESAGLRVEALEDLSEETLPTFAAWRRNLDANRDRVAKTLGEEGVRSFEASCEFLTTLWHEGTLGYGLMAASKPLRSGDPVRAGAGFRP